MSKIPNFSEINSLPIAKATKKNKKNTNFIEEKITIKELDYYFTNAISRSSKTMAECKKIRKKTNN